MAHTKLKPVHQDIKVAVDNVILTVKNGELFVLLIQMNKSPYKGMWALPGGLVQQKETLEQAASRFLKEQTAVTKVYLEQLYTFSDIKRDASGRVIACAYFALIPPDKYKLQTNPKYTDVRWWNIKELPKLAYDHEKIAKYGKKRLQWKLEYTNVAWSLLAKEFTMSDLQLVYEAAAGKLLDKRNFRKKIAEMNIIRGTGKKAVHGAHRPAELFTFKSKTAKIIG